jgi:hypothetical protein
MGRVPEPDPLSLGDQLPLGRLEMVVGEPDGFERRSSLSSRALLSPPFELLLLQSRFVA